MDMKAIYPHESAYTIRKSCGVGLGTRRTMKIASFAKLFDHSIVRPECDPGAGGRLRGDGGELKTATLTVQPHYVRFAADSDARVRSPRGNRRGLSRTATKRPR